MSLDPERTWWTEMARDVASDPSTWRRMAGRLRDSAEVLWARFEAGIPRGNRNPDWGLLQPALLLAGYALENLIKGLLVQQDPTRVGTDALQRWDAKGGHDLGDLFQVAGVKLDDEERTLVERLGGFVRWAGRYPVPLKFDEITPIGSGGLRPLEISDRSRPREWQVFRRLYERVEGELQWP